MTEDTLTPLAPATKRDLWRGKHVLLIMLAIIVVATVPAVLVPILWNRGKPPRLEDLGTIPPFSLVDERGQAFTEEAMTGHPTIVSFIFTRCDTICPVTTMKMAHVQEQTFDAPRVKLLSLSVDPTYDTPAQLTAYALKYKADPERWRFVTGPAETIRALVEGPFLTSMQREADRPGGIPNIAHGGYFLLIDAERHIRGMYESNDLHRIDQLMHDARYLARISK
jgi:protein SCO1/2